VELSQERSDVGKKYLLLKDTPHLVMTNNVPEIVPPVAALLREVM
jgi:hypothetical protein